MKAVVRIFREARGADGGDDLGGSHAGLVHDLHGFGGLVLEERIGEEQFPAPGDAGRVGGVHGRGIREHEIAVFACHRVERVKELLERGEDWNRDGLSGLGCEDIDESGLEVDGAPAEVANVYSEMICIGRGSKIIRKIERIRVRKHLEGDFV